MDRDTGWVLDWECGNRDAKTLRKLAKRIEEKYHPEVYCTDEFKAYAKELPENRLVQSKAETYGIESLNSNIRHWLGRFRRRVKIVSQAVEMVNASIRLLVQYRINGTLESLQAQYISVFT